MDRPDIIGDIIQHYLKHLAPRTAIAFCVTVAHAEHVAQCFLDAGIPAASIDGTMSTEKRRDAAQCRWLPVPPPAHVGARRCLGRDRVAALGARSRHPQRPGMAVVRIAATRRWRPVPTPSNPTSARLQKRWVYYAAQAAAEKQRGAA